MKCNRLASIFSRKCSLFTKYSFKKYPLWTMKGVIICNPIYAYFFYIPGQVAWVDTSISFITTHHRKQCLNGHFFKWMIDFSSIYISLKLQVEHLTTTFFFFLQTKSNVINFQCGVNWKVYSESFKIELSFS